MRLIAAVLAAVGVAGLATASARSTGSEWQIHDLGTLGGPSSSAVGVNERGQVIGSADIGTKSASGRDLHHAFLWQDGRMIDLGTLGGPESEAVAINEAGQVVGISDIHRADKYGLHMHHAFLWQRGRMIDLGTLGGPESEAAAINRNGWVAGTADTAAAGNFGEPAKHAFRWRDGKMRDLGTLGGVDSQATALSDGGTVVGWSEAKSGGFRSTAFTWQNGRMHDLHYPAALLTPGGRIARAWGKLSPPGAGYAGGRALALNEHGDSAGFCARYIRGEVPAQPCAWLHGKAVALGLLRHGFRGRAFDLNNSDQIVGRTGIGPPSGKNHAFLWQDGRMTDLGGLRPNDWSVALAITDSGLIVGYSRRATATPPHAVIWTPRRPNS